MQALPAVNDPYAIFAQARKRLQAARYPRQVSYQIAVSVTKDGITSVAHYRSYYDSSTGAVSVIGVSDEEQAHPYTPRGVNTYLNLFGSGKGIPLSEPQRTFDYMGVPFLAPNYSFGVERYVPRDSESDDAALVRKIRFEFHDRLKPLATVPAPSSSLKNIATVEALSRDYVMQLAGMEDIRGHHDYHIKLHPLQNPGRYRLRAVWIDSASFFLDRVITQGNFVSGGATTIPWTTDFANVGGQPYIESEHTAEAFSQYRRDYDSATVSFLNIVPTPIPPYARLSSVLVDEETGIPPLTEPQ